MAPQKKKESQEQEKLTIARNALKAGLPPDQVANITGLSRQALQPLKDDEHTLQTKYFIETTAVT